jgi:hypothetical protein
MTFDFSGLRSNPPAGCKVLQADKQCFRMQNGNGAEFCIVQNGLRDFSLFHASPATRQREFVMRTDLPRLLFLLGYNRNPK